MDNATVNKVIAEKLYGIVPDDSRCERCGFPLRESLELGCVAGNCSQRPLPPIRELYPDYCSSAELAFGPGGVVEKMRERGWMLELESRSQHPARLATDIMEARFNSTNQDFTNSMWWFAVTCSEAVDLAAAAALLSEKE